MQNHIACQRHISDFSFHMAGALCQWRNGMEKSKLYKEIQATIRDITTVGGMSQAGPAHAGFFLPIAI